MSARRRATVVAGSLVVLSLFMAPAGASAVLFKPAVHYAAGNGPVAVAVRDLNGDHRPDIVAADLDTDKVSVLLAGAAGGFARTTYAVGDQPVSVAIGDVNDDQRHDLVVADRAANTVSVLLGTGTGKFGAAHDYPVGGGPSSVAVADLDGNGTRDVVTTNRSTSNLSVLRGRGDGTFPAPVNFPAAHAPGSLSLGDFNGDKRPDLAFRSGAGASVKLAAPGGGYGAVANYPVSASYPPRTVATGDVSGDGHLDLLSGFDTSVPGDDGDWGVEVSLGQSSGAFGPHGGGFNLCCSEPLTIAVGDLNGDGLGDVAVTHLDENAKWVVTVVRGGLGGVSFPIGAPSVSLAIADLDGDGHLDIVTAEPDLDQVSVLHNAGISERAEAQISGGIGFADRFAGSTSPGGLVTVTNTGSTFPLGLQAPTLGGADPRQFTLSDDTCTGSVPPGGHCTFKAHFRPTTVGTKSATVSVGGNMGGSPLEVALHGTGIPPLIVVRESLDFGAHPVGTTTLRHGLISVTNAGDAPMTVGPPTLGGADRGQFTLTDDTCTAAVAPGAHCSFQAHFAPTTRGVKTAIVSVPNSTADTPRHVTLSGNGW